MKKRTISSLNQQDVRGGFPWTITTTITLTLTGDDSPEKPPKKGKPHASSGCP